MLYGKFLLCNVDDACVRNAPWIIMHFLDLCKVPSEEGHARQLTSVSKCQFRDASHAVRNYNTIRLTIAVLEHMV